MKVDRGSRPTRLRITGTLVSIAVVLVAVISINVRSRQDMDWGLDDAIVLLLIAAPSLALIPISIRWRIWPWLCASALVGWGLFIGPRGDMSCTDCAFALLIPMWVAIIQLVLFLAEWGIRRSRARDRSDR